METSGYRLLLPEGTLDYFIISDVKESSTEIVIYLEEKNEVPGEYSSMQVESKGFYEPVVVQDFPIRGKKLFLNIRRRRWIVKDEGRYVSRNWKLVAEGSRITHDFASFLTYIIHSGFISGYQNRYGDNLKPPTNVYHRMTA